MIILIEPQCVGWQHEGVNAGFIECVKRNIGEETVKVFAEKGHIQCLRHLLTDVEKDILFYAIDVPNKKLDYATSFVDYYRLFRKIFCNEENSSARAIFLLSCNKGNLIAIKKMVLLFEKTNFYIVMHAIAEQLINKEKVPRHTIVPFKWILDEFSEKRNVRLITYSPLAKDVLSNVLKRKTLDKIVFFHHPFPTWKQKIQDVNGDGKMHIAILGAGVRKDVYDFINLIDKEITGKITFDIMSRSEIDFTKLKNVRIINKGQTITNTEISKLIGESYFVFLPYTHKEYRVSCSGVLIDAIRNAVPILSFDSSLVVWYNQYHIGKVCSSHDEMRDYLIQLNDNKNDRRLYQQNISALRQRMIEENDVTMRQFCGGGRSE